MAAGVKNSSEEHSSDCRRLRVSEVAASRSFQGRIMQCAAINMLYVEIIEIAELIEQMHQALADDLLLGETTKFTNSS
jgi:hypothetical protein